MEHRFLSFPFRKKPVMRRFPVLPLALSVFLLAGCSAATTGGDPLPSSAEGMVRLGKLMKERGDIGPAIDFYRRALQIDDHNLAAFIGLAEVMEKWGDKDAALEIYRDGVAAQPKSAALRRGYAKMLLAHDDAVGAREQYEKALDIDDDDVKARSGLGVALDYLGEHEAAQREYKKVLRAEPRNLAAMNNLAYSHILMRQYEQAIKLLEPEANNKAATPALRQNLALAYGLSGMEADAQRIAAMDLSPEKVAETMDYYRRQRAEIAVSTAPYAEMGSYATEAMAVAQIRKMQEHLDKTGKNAKAYKPVVLPQVSTPGGTPRFAVRMMGCTRPDEISRLCETLAPLGLPCTTQGR